MTSKIDQSNKIRTIFRFASGHILALNEDQIAKIPYLSAMISSADRFESARDEHGHYKLDPHINYQHFSFALQSLSFRSDLELFTRLPEEENVIPIVALLDFLGLLPQPVPTLKEVDSTFYSRVVYSPHCKEYLRIVKPDVMQDMAVRFSIALVKEEYDFDQCQVMDQIYWFVMFILSVRKWFEPKLCHHVYTTAKNCFAVFKPSLLKSLEELEHTSKKDNELSYLILLEEHYSRLSDNYTYLYPLQHTVFNELNEYFHGYWFRHFPFNGSSRRFVRSIHEGGKWFWREAEFFDKDPLVSIYDRVLEIMYARLQTEICQQAMAELHQRKNLYKPVTTKSYFMPWLYLFESELLPKKIDEIFKTQYVQEEIDALILQDMCRLTPALQRKHAELVKSIREQEKYNTPETYELVFDWYPSYYLDYETKQETALSYELLLNKLNKDPYSIIEDLRKRVLRGLNEVALEQVKQWENTQREIHELESELKKGKSLHRLIHDIKSEIRRQQQPGDFSHIGKKKSKHRQYQLTAPTASFNCPFKRSKR